MTQKAGAKLTPESHQKFKTGNVVRLNSGGPELCVRTHARKRVRCCWYVNGILKEAEFREDMLMPDTPEQSELDFARRLIFALAQAKKQSLAELVGGLGVADGDSSKT